MDIQEEREAFESKLKQIGKVDDSNFTVADDGSYEWDSIHFAWTIWQAAKAQEVPYEPGSFKSSHEIIINETKSELIDGYDIAKEDEYLLESLVYRGVCIGKAQAVPEWIEYEKKSPRIDGRYQIFIHGEQLVADWESPYGFSSAEDGTAFIQELITHWSVLSNDPVIEAQEQKG